MNLTTNLVWLYTRSIVLGLLINLFVITIVLHTLFSLIYFFLFLFFFIQIAFLGCLVSSCYTSMIAFLLRLYCFQLIPIFYWLSYSRHALGARLLLWTPWNLLNLFFIFQMVPVLLVQPLLIQVGLLIKESFRKGMVLLFYSFSFPFPVTNIQAFRSRQYLARLFILFNVTPLASRYLHQLIE